MHAQTQGFIHNLVMGYNMFGYVSNKDAAIFDQNSEHINIESQVYEFGHNIVQEQLLWKCPDFPKGWCATEPRRKSAPEPKPFPHLTALADFLEDNGYKSYLRAFIKNV